MPSAVVTLKQTSAKAVGTYKVGDEIVLSVSVSVKGMDGIFSFQAREIIYDKTALKYEGVIINDNSWILASQDEQIFIYRNKLVDATGVICKIKFKVLKEQEQYNVKLDLIDAASISELGFNTFDDNVNIPSITIKATPKKEETKTEVEVKAPVTTPNETEVSKPTATPDIKPVEEQMAEIGSNDVYTEVIKTVEKENETKIDVSEQNVIKETPSVEEVETTDIKREIQSKVDETKQEIINQKVTELENENLSEEDKQNIIEVICDCIASVVTSVVDAMFKILGLSL